MRIPTTLLPTRLLLAAASVLAPVGVSSAAAEKPATFADDAAFLGRHTEVIMLQNGAAAVAVAPAYQGRVMTSTFDRAAGPSFGWINRPVIEAGLLSDAEREGKLEEHIYIFGGEERFWLGPEGGQYALFFEPGSEFDFSVWKTPAAIDTEAYAVVQREATTVKFAHQCELVNFHGTHFDVGIERTVTLLDAGAVTTTLGSAPDDRLQWVGYETDNRITNRGAAAWTAERGLISIWMLGMYNPSPETTVVIPFKPGDAAERGPKVTDDYFGKVPTEHLRVEDQVMFFRGDGTRRGKIGVNAQRSTGFAGSYDATGQVLTLVTYNVQAAPEGYVNSVWEMQEKPYGGDVINAYNDGSPTPGAPPLGPFYELETSSPAAALKPGETMCHVQQTLHLHGPEDLLDPISQRLLGAGLAEIKTAF